MSYGQNVPFYLDSVDVVDAVDPADVGWRPAAHRIAASPVPILRSGLRLFIAASYHYCNCAVS